MFLFDEGAVLWAGPPVCRSRPLAPPGVVDDLQIFSVKKVVEAQS